MSATMATRTRAIWFRWGMDCNWGTPSIPGSRTKRIPRSWRLTTSGPLAQTIWPHSRAFFRTYNLGLFSDFGEGLIRQSEFRTVEGAEVRETHTFKPWLEGMAGVLYNEDDIRNDNLDHYLSDNPQSSGPFVKVLANNVTVREFAPYLAIRGEFGRHLRFYAGLTQ